MSVVGSSSGVEGSQITFYCQPGLVPTDSEEMVANCTNEGIWKPDPAVMTCKGACIYYKLIFVVVAIKLIPLIKPYLFQTGPVIADHTCMIILRYMSDDVHLVSWVIPGQT